MSAPNKLTPAGLQVERALDQGFDVAAYNIYFANISDGIAMVDGDWPAWHRMIQQGSARGPYSPTTQTKTGRRAGIPERAGRGHRLPVNRGTASGDGDGPTSSPPS